jgi:type VI secretion system secreted protein Hcp
MALGAYLTIVAERQGLIRGSVTQKGREDKIAVIYASHEIAMPRDPASGRVTGKRAHKPFLCTKELDRSSPLLYFALTHNENLPEARIDFWTSTPMGLEKQHYTVRLTDATISGIHFRLPNTRSPRLARRPEYEEVSFVYKKIEWTWTEGNISASDDWETAR